MRKRRAAVISNLASLVLFAACASTAPVIESFDPGTGITVSRTSTPLILYHDNSAAAAHARDFVYVGPVAVNEMGQYRYYLWVGIWSAIDTVDASLRRDGFESVVIFADGEPLLLDVHGWAANSIGASETIYVKPVATAAEAYYPVTLDQIRLLAAARDISLQAGASNGIEYRLWEDQKSARDSLREFATLP